MLACNSCQGYYFARPMSADDLATLLEQHPAGGSVHLPAAASG
jgi:EAL domain-containing protein (putative c-di-GMP-specific phosphodiesterase class I)